MSDAKWSPFNPEHLFAKYRTMPPHDCGTALEQGVSQPVAKGTIFLRLCHTLAIDTDCPECRKQFNVGDLLEMGDL